MDSDVDEEVEILGLHRPSLIDELRSVLDEYPDDGQILKELIQNAEDAGARSVNIVVDKRLFHHDLDSKVLEEHEHLHYWQGPALCVTNDAVFSAMDWKGIRMLHASIKDKDALKVGRFGLGFKSVFHLTDRLVILSGKVVLYMDPSKGEHCYCTKKSLTKIKGRELESILHCVENLFGITRQDLKEKGFPQTLFWLPLRQVPSDLSATVYSSEKVSYLLAAFRTEASSMLLFLNSIESVHIFTREDMEEPNEIFSVAVADDCDQKVRQERNRFKARIAEEGNGTFPDQPFHYITEITITTVQKHEEIDRMANESWLVSVYHAGLEDVSQELLGLWSRLQISYRPYVGVAAPLDGQQDFRSQVFCFLPLPLEKQSPSGLPVHVHGYFALSQNRRHLKWPSADQLSRWKSMEAPMQWNCLLVKELLPKVYYGLLEWSRKFYATSPERFYALWPDINEVKDRWQPLLKPLYAAVVKYHNFYSMVCGGQWKLLTECVLQEFDPDLMMKLYKQSSRGMVDKHRGNNVLQAVSKVFHETGQALLKLPSHVLKTLHDLELLHNIDCISASGMLALLPACLERLEDVEKLHILHYLCCHDNAPGLLHDLELLPLQGGSFGTFTQQTCQSTLTFFCDEKLVTLFPGLESRFCRLNLSEDLRDHLHIVALSGKTSLCELKEDSLEICQLIKDSVLARFKGSDLILPQADAWIHHLWEFLTSTKPWCEDLSEFSDLPILPFQCSDSITLLPLNGIYVSASVQNREKLPSEMETCLQKLGVTVLPEVPDYASRHCCLLGTYVKDSSPEGVLQALTCISKKELLCSAAVKEANSKASTEERRALVDMLKMTTRTEVNKASDLLQQLQLFPEASSPQLKSVKEVPEVAPVDCPPVLLPRPLLSNSHKDIAVKLGAKEIPWVVLMKEILESLKSGNSFSDNEITTFMKFFLNHRKSVEDNTLVTLARQIRCVPSQFGQFRQAQDMYDPSSGLLEELFSCEDRFPCKDFAEGPLVPQLKILGLRTETCVDPSHLIKTAELIEQFWTEKEIEKAVRKADALLNYLISYGDTLLNPTLKILSGLQCLPCLQMETKPDNYPNSLQIQSESLVCRPRDMFKKSSAYLVGSVKPVLKQDIPDDLAYRLRIENVFEKKYVVNHLINVVDSFRCQDTLQYRLLMKRIFEWLKDNVKENNLLQILQEEKCILTETNCFLQPKCFWLETTDEDMDLKPYRYPLPRDIVSVHDFLVKCGSRHQQDDTMLMEVIGEIQKKHSTSVSDLPSGTTHTQPDQVKAAPSGVPDILTSRQPCQDKDLHLVINILGVLSRRLTATDGSILVPISHRSGGLLFRPARECTIIPNSSLLDDLNDEEIVYVHPLVPESTALGLGALTLKDRALAGVEELDFGQREELTTRLRDLLKDSYTDGFSVPKELVQNADDAGATEVSFLLDEREHLDSQENLISEKMASLQGPALYVFNNAFFTEQDFENIQQLGARSKEHDATKIGKFGLGFNTVYNLTDTPFFVSGHVLAIFDPHTKYLQRPGLKLDFTRSWNRALLSRMPNQFQPFQNVFNCKLHKDEETEYLGTLFRFPFRTPEQAKDSKIKNESYSEDKRKQFLRMLLEKAGNLLIFAQNVQRLNVFYLPSHSSDASAADCLLSITKSSFCETASSRVDLKGLGVLQYCSDEWAQGKDVDLVERVQINVQTTRQAEIVCSVAAVESTSHWHIAWAVGTEESAKLASRMTGVVPLAAVAAFLDDDKLKSLKDAPQGFYHSGHLFCFMPLPEEAVDITLPVHVNGTFALASDRRSLLMETEDDFRNEEAEWNLALFSDAVSRAYITLLESLLCQTTLKMDQTAYFALWPLEEKLGLLKHFYRHLIASSRTVLSSANNEYRHVAFRDACFLDSHLRESDCGEIAWAVMQNFCGHEKQLVDLPSIIEHSLEKAGQSEVFMAQVTSELGFYRDVFFPNIDSEWWASEERDRLVLHAIMQDTEEVNELIKRHRCIPSCCTSKLSLPCELVSPDGKAAILYEPADGQFPQSANECTTSMPQVDFCSANVQGCLIRLGLLTDNLPWNMVIERAKSVRVLCEKNFKDACKRAQELINYLSLCEHLPHESISQACPTEQLKEIPFLPVVMKPKDWPFPWGGGKEATLLAAPKELYSDSMKELIACNASLINLEKIGGVLLNDGAKKDVLRCLGVVVEEDYSSPYLLELVIDQLLLIAASAKEILDTCRELTDSVCTRIYSYITKCLENSNSECVKELVHKRLQGKKIVWTKFSFTYAHRLAFRNDFDCHPYLFQLESNWHQFRPFFETVGVKERFETDDILSVLHEIAETNKGKSLSPDLVDATSHIALLLCTVGKGNEENLQLKKNKIFLPDQHGLMQSVDHLCLNDCEWVTESESMKFVHDTVSAAAAETLGVRTKKRQDYDALTEPVPFGQHEKLTKRIKRLLQSYTVDSSFLKELLQNADDAGATEVKFIQDFRTLGKEKVPEGWEKLQGPALCVYNNSSFTADDMKGIQNLGQGSKAEDNLKTGQFGVGFNVVYHVTDVPSFWTLQDETTEVLCILDPNCLYLPDRKPGVKMANMKRIREVYGDMFSGYLPDFVDMTKPGTLFRLPLRTKEMALKSDITDEAVSLDKIKSLLYLFKYELYTSLLFLSNIRSVGVYSMDENGSIRQEYEVTLQMNFTDAQKFDDYKERLVRLSENISADSDDQRNIEQFETCLEVSLSDTRHQVEQWLVVHRAGFDDPQKSTKLVDSLKQENQALLPHGSVALKLAEKESKSRVAQHETKHKVFCVLPLPGYTGLPMHVNGMFALNYEARHSLWENDGDARTAWNMAIALDIIVPAYLTALQRVRDMFFPLTLQADKILKSKWSQYFDLFPGFNATLPDIWKAVIKKIYQRIADDELSLFPVIAKDSATLKWVAVTRKQKPISFFKDPGDFCTTNTVQVMAADHCGPADGSALEENLSPTEVSLTGKQTECIPTLLKGLNMHVLDAPFQLYKNFHDSGVESVQKLSPQNVLCFLKSSDMTNDGGCNIGKLPRPVVETPLENTRNVLELVKFVENDPEFLKELDDLPLCLRQSGTLYHFKNVADKERPIVCKSFFLLPGSTDSFLHDDIRDSFTTDRSNPFVRQMDIDTFESLLSQTLTDTCFRQGVPCDFVTDVLPSEDWISKVWEFLKCALEQSKSKNDTEESKNDTDSALNMENNLRCLVDWNLIPVKNGQSSEKQLYPVRMFQSVVYVAKNANHSNPRLQKILMTLPLAFLDTESLPEDNMIISQVASVDHPRTLLHALASSLGASTKVSFDDALVILKYFSDNLSVLEKSCQNQEELIKVKDDLKQLPCYGTVDSSTVSLESSAPVFCVVPSVPGKGILQWSCDRPDPVVVLCKQGIPDALQKCLGISDLTIEQFYCDFLLPTLSSLPKNCVISHMKFLRDYLKGIETYGAENDANKEKMEKISSVLKETAFIEVDGLFYKASTFYTPDHPVFKAMCSESEFPPESYRQRDWASFLKQAGIIHKVSEEMFIKFANSLAAESAGKPLDDKILKKSKILTDHLFSRAGLQESDLLSCVQNTQFIQPSEWRSCEEHKPLMFIVKPHEPYRLVSLAESSPEDDLYLTWSSCPILHPNVTKQLQRKILHHDLPEMGLSGQLFQQKVFQHVRNLCTALSGQNGQNIFQHLHLHYQHLLQNIMTKIYSFLQNRCKAASQLNGLPIICSVEKCQMLKPETVVMDLQEEEDIPSFIHKAPAVFGQFQYLFKCLGVSERVTANHYALVLGVLFNEHVPLHAEKLKIAKKAVERLFVCMMCKENERRQLAVPCLYLPSGNQLFPSTDLVFVDSQDLRKRFTAPSVALKFFDPNELELPQPVPVSSVKNLPQKYRMTCLSDIIREFVPGEIKRLQNPTGFSRYLEEKLKDQSFSRGVVRLSYDQHKHSKQGGAFNEENEQLVGDALSRITIKEVAGLVTAVEVKGKVIEKSKQEKLCFVERSSDDLPACTVYIDSAALSPRQTKHIECVFYSLATAIQIVVGFQPVYTIYLKLLCEDVSSAIYHMNCCKLSQYDTGFEFQNTSEGSASASNCSTSSTAFFSNMHQHGRTYYECDFEASNQHAGSNLSGQTNNQSQPNPESAEALHCIQQAEREVAVAFASREGCAGTKGYSWVCYICHQAMKKALKAVLYHRNADNTVLISSKLVSLAVAVGDDQLLEMAQTMKGQIGQQPTRMPLPDSQSSPPIPSEVDYAADMIDLANHAVERVRMLLGME